MGSLHDWLVMGMKRTVRAALAAALGCSALAMPVAGQAPAEPTAMRDGRDATSSGVPVVEVGGGAEAIGRAYGQRLSGAMHELFERYLLKRIDTDAKRWLALMAARSFAQYIEPHHLLEIRAVAAAGGFSEAEVLLAQCFLDLSPMTACSSVSLPAEAFSDGVPRLARNLDFPSLNIADKHSILVIYRPEGRYAFASVGWPGMIGVLSGMNEHGLVLVNMEVDRPGGVPRAMPYTLLYRTVLERCRTVDEAIQYLQSAHRQTPNNLMLMDSAGNRAVLEITPADITVRRGAAGDALVSTNHHRGLDAAMPGHCSRYDLLMTESRKDFGDINLRHMQAMLSGVQQGKMTLQAMVFEPSTRTLHLATGSRAADRQMRRIDLAPYFGAAAEGIGAEK